MKLPSYQIALALLIPSMGPAQESDPQVLRSYSVAAQQLLWINWTTKSLEDIKKRQAFLDNYLGESRVDPNDSWYDLRPFLEERLEMGFGEVGFALWNQETLDLLIQAPKSELAPVHELLAKWKTGTEHPRNVVIEAICLRTLNPPDTSVFLRESANLANLLAGNYGAAELLSVTNLRSKSGEKAETEQIGPAPGEALKLEVDSVIGVDGYLIDLKFHYEIALKDGVFFSQTSFVTLSQDQPLLLELGGNGTPKSPMHFLLLRAWAEPVP